MFVRGKNLMTKVKICGITNLEDALASAKFGADALGFNFYGKSPRYISPEKAGEIIEKLPKKILKVGVFVNESLEKILEIIKTAKLDAAQLHGEETPEFARRLKAKTNLEIVKAFRVSESFKIEDVLRYEVDAVLIDAYSPSEHGGTGETFDWEVAKKVRRIFPTLYLAGGLNDDNIVKAISEVAPFAVDVCSCLESEKGIKDKIKLINLISKVKQFDWWLKISSLENYKVRNIYEYLNLIHLRPALYIGSNSLTVLKNFLTGFREALLLVPNDFDWKNFYSFEFHEFIKSKLGKNDYAGLNGFNVSLYECDEEKAFDHFFALLEEFKLEKEDLSDE